MSTSNLRTRITKLLPAYGAGTNVTVRQIAARLNSSRVFTPVANATVRGRLSELVRDGQVGSEYRDSGRTGFYLNNS